MERLSHRLEAMLVLGLQRLAAFIPWSAIGWLASPLGWLLPFLFPTRHRLVLSNLRFAFRDSRSEHELHHLAWSVYAHLARWAFEFLKLSHLSREEIIQRVRLTGKEYIEEGLAKGKGVIIVTGHVGNFELMGARLAAEGFPLVVLARHQDNPEVSALIESIRRRAGTEVVWRRQSLRQALRTLRENKVLGMLIDQHTGGGGAVVVDFFGRPAGTHKSAALLALRTGATLIIGFDVRQADGDHVVTICPPIQPARTGDLEEDTQQMTIQITQLIESQIRRHPEQWFWIHDRWKAARSVGRVREKAERSLEGGAM